MTGARVLVVEDNDEVAQMLVLFFGSRGLKVTIAVDGASALEKIRDALPTLILLDVGLPDIDGYELFKKFRESARSRYIPVIFLTRRSRKSDRIAGLQLGADDFITKPFDLEELYLRVQNAVRRAERENLSDPRTGLPSGQVVREELAAARGAANRVVCGFSLRHSSEFRDLYGALAGADLLRYTALLMNRVLNSLGAPDDFLGQLSEESFVVITAPERADRVRQAIIDGFNRDAAQHYAFGERLGDRVKVKDPAGREQLLPLLGLETATVP
jgi:DNA-binding response OmpR family regulator